MRVSETSSRLILFRSPAMTPSMSWWWWRGAALKSEDEQVAERSPFQSVALVVDSTGIVGTSLVDMLPLPDTPGGPWKVYALSRRPLPPWSPPPRASVTHLHLDLADPGAVAEALAPLSDVTHVFYAAWSPRATEARNLDVNSAMLRNVLSVVVPNCPALAHVSLQTGTMHYMGPPEAFGRTTALDPPYTEDMPRLDWPNLYYGQEDLLFDAVARRGDGDGEGGAISWSVHRPNLIFGFSPRSAMNIVCSLCVYAAICRKDGVPLRWPGSLGTWEGFSSASDADLIAQQQIWAAVDPVAKNEGEENRVKASEAMAGKEAVWAEIVEENQLVPTQLHEVANWWFVDALFSVQVEFLDSMNKSKEYGFLGFRNTAKSFNSWIDRMRAYKIVP
ncbi:hypothetical protein PVAP13_8NG149500 [Panicum virgatum]|uniref:PRISE-like Rossmann-fold domain-containing protein n=1 Tax=Panicum virgatum TaxID=38727 RepID=A0A8T0P3K9_PANVG|nr:hypothetical protein PVAP13_8NG149500 [Panicum virgatum]